MVTIKNKNLSRQTLEGYTDTIFDGCNISQAAPNTNPFVRCSNLEFRNCNLNNVAVPEEFTTDGTNNNNQIEFIEEFEEIEFTNADGSITDETVLINIKKDVKSSGAI